LVYGLAIATSLAIASCALMGSFIAFATFILSWDESLNHVVLWFWLSIEITWWGEVTGSIGSPSKALEQSKCKCIISFD
jgi:hypothetical protein